MISLPEGFDAAALATEVFGIAAPFVAIGFIIACGFLIVNILRNAGKSVS